MISVVKKRVSAVFAFDFQPKIFLVSTFLAFFACCWGGRWAATQPTLKNEVRLNEYLNPMFHFYPTASMLRSSALAGLRPDQTLILIGGNSNFNGQGQNPSELWTLELQRILGDGYKVVNFATMGSKSTDLAGVVFRMIESQRPNTLLILNSYSTMQGSFDGADDFGIPSPTPFTYVFWDAHYKGLIEGSEKFKEEVRRLQKVEWVDHANEFQELHIGAWIDSWSYARDLWTYLDYESFFTVWLPLRSEAPFRARKFVREVDRKFPSLNERVAKSGMSNDEIMQNVRGHFQGVAKYDDAGTIVPVEANWESFVKSHDRLFDPGIRNKIMFCLLWPSPYFVAKLDEKDQKLLKYVIPRAKHELESLGYRATSIGADFEGDDYETSFHFVASGGRKIAAIVAAKIQSQR